MYKVFNVARCRPRIEEELIKQIKIKYPTETALLSNEETVTWAIKKLLTSDTEAC